MELQMQKYCGINIRVWMDTNICPNGRLFDWLANVANVSGKGAGPMGRYDGCMQDKRSEVRMMCADVVQASWTGKDGRLQHADALLENISPSGACLQFEVGVPLGVNLRFTCEGHEFTGEVRYCSYNEIGYFVGVELEPRSQWSRRMFKPRHLLDLQELVDNASKRRRE
jgi:hypothetical protein